MTISAKIIADSVSENRFGVFRLVTMETRYPRLVHAEHLRHRKFSFSSSSSRAIPISRMIMDIVDDPAMPVEWGSNKPGMQAGDELGEDYKARARDEWVFAMQAAVESAQALAAIGVHKQIANRVLEPFMHQTVLVSGTDWANFFALRLHKDADPTIRALAGAMWEEMGASKPTELKPGEWHLPYIHFAECDLPMETLRKISAARCARVSYLTHDGETPTVEKDLALYDRLAGSQPIHASPLEHQGTPDEVFWTGWDYDSWARPDLHGNFTGWVQHRKMIEGECVRDAAHIREDLCA